MKKGKLAFTIPTLIAAGAAPLTIQDSFADTQLSATESMIKNIKGIVLDINQQHTYSLAQHSSHASHGSHGIGFAGRGSRYFIYYETVGGGTGGTAFKDGVDCCHNTSNLPIEAAELEFPLHVECLEFVPDSEGPGQFRGGLGVRKAWKILDDSFINTHSLRHTIHPQGLFGGYEAPGCRIVLNAGEPDETLLSRLSTLVEVSPGDVLSVVTPGGGGLGPPEERAPERVLRDYLNDKISLARARSVYRVAIDAETGQVDQEATRRLRQPVPDGDSRPAPGAGRS